MPRSCAAWVLAGRTAGGPIPAPRRVETPVSRGTVPGAVTTGREVRVLVTRALFRVPRWPAEPKAAVWDPALPSNHHHARAAGDRALRVALRVDAKSAQRRAEELDMDSALAEERPASMPKPSTMGSRPSAAVPTLGFDPGAQGTHVPRGSPAGSSCAPPSSRHSPGGVGPAVADDQALDPMPSGLNVDARIPPLSGAASPPRASGDPASPRGRCAAPRRPRRAGAGPHAAARRPASRGRA
jgi:hypothetical protein